MKKGKKPQDATLRNIRVSRRKEKSLERRVKDLETEVEALSAFLDLLWGAVAETTPKKKNAKGNPT